MEDEITGEGKLALSSPLVVRFPIRGCSKRISGRICTVVPIQWLEHKVFSVYFGIDSGTLALLSLSNSLRNPTKSCSDNCFRT